MSGLFLNWISKKATVCLSLFFFFYLAWCKSRDTTMRIRVKGTSRQLARARTKCKNGELNGRKIKIPPNNEITAWWNIQFYPNHTSLKNSIVKVMRFWSPIYLQMRWWDKEATFGYPSVCRSYFVEYWFCVSRTNLLPLNRWDTYKWPGFNPAIRDNKILKVGICLTN